LDLLIGEAKGLLDRCQQRRVVEPHDKGQKKREPGQMQDAVLALK
ncbi:MAG: hypothetical protein HW386_1607, partial [Gammaproteobacteria bacterium]|nr:hypothetical protein [Gammaproteobacteria bacterium]